MENKAEKAADGSDCHAGKMTGEWSGGGERFKKLTRATAREWDGKHERKNGRNAET